MSRAPATSVTAYMSVIENCVLPCILLVAGFGASSASAEVRPAALFADDIHPKNKILLRGIYG